MSKIDDLLKEMCPNGVEYKKISDVLVIKNNGQFTKDMLQENGKYPAVNSSRDILGRIDEFNNSENTLVLTSHGAYAGFCLFMKEKYYAGPLCYPMDSLNDKILNIKYAYYFFKNNELKIRDTFVNKSGVPYINIKALMHFNMPVPPLPIQKEIVKILDNFTELTAELTTELTARKKQYEYYKQKLFNDLKCDTQIKHITDIALVKARVGWQRLTTAEYLNTGNYYLITGTDFKSDGTIDFSKCVFVSKDRYEMDSNIIVHKNDILITKDGTLGKVAFLNEEPKKPATLNSGVFRIKINDENIVPKYLYYYFTSKYFTDFVESVKTGSTIPHLTQQGLISLDIPIPCKSAQERIVKILDSFDTISSNLNIGLPAEIEARQKQYEYYRDKLLTF